MWILRSQLSIFADLECERSRMLVRHCNILSKLQLRWMSAEAVHCMIAMYRCQLDKYEYERTSNLSRSCAPQTCLRSTWHAHPGMVKCYTQRVTPRLLSNLESKVRCNQFPEAIQVLGCLCNMETPRTIASDMDARGLLAGPSRNK